MEINQQINIEIQTLIAIGKLFDYHVTINNELNTQNIEFYKSIHNRIQVQIKNEGYSIIARIKLPTEKCYTIESRFVDTSYVLKTIQESLAKG